MIFLEKYKIIEEYSNSLIKSSVAKEIQNEENLVIINQVSIEKSDKEKIDEFNRKAIILKNISNKGITKYIEIDHFVKDDKDIYYSIQKKPKGVSLDSFIKEKKEFSQDDFLKITISLLNILDYLDKNSIIFGNINPKNIFITEDYSVFLVNSDILNDFIEKDEENPYIAPEKLIGYSSTKSDQYSVGVSLISLLIKKDAKEILFNGKFHFQENYGITKDIVEFLEILTEKKANYRLENISRRVEYMINFYKINIKKDNTESNLNKENINEFNNESQLNRDNALITDTLLTEDLDTNNEILSDAEAYETYKTYKALKKQETLSEQETKDTKNRSFFLIFIVITIGLSLLLIVANAGKKIEDGLSGKKTKQWSNEQIRKFNKAYNKKHKYKKEDLIIEKK